MMNLPTDATPPGRSPLDLMVSFADSTRDWSPLRELALILDVEGVLDDLDDNDARHVIGAVLVDVLADDDARLRARAEWIDSGEGAGPLHDPAGSAAALRQIADLLELPGGAAS